MTVILNVEKFESFVINEYEQCVMEILVLFRF